MKELILLVLVCCGLSLVSANECCPGDHIMRPRGYCGNNTQRININCTFGHVLLKDVIVEGTKVSTQDSPHFVFADDPNDYCLGLMYRNQNITSLGLMPVAVVCYQEPTTTNRVETSGILTLISVIFLLVTFAVYMYLPQLRDLQGLCYMCMCISMALGFLTLGILQLNQNFEKEVCTVIGFLVYFWMMATFFWMNVISINMYRTVMDATYLKRTERKQYFLYNCYAWGGSLFFLMVALICNFSEGDHLKPGIGKGSCWFQGRTETWLFFYGPIAILITANVSLFIMSSYTLWRHTGKYEVNKLNNLKHKFLLSLKLFLVMGITWTFEIISFAHGQQHILWDIMDTFNCLQGCVIFVLLVVLRKRAILGLANENCCIKITRPLADKLNPNDDSDDQEILAEDNNMEVRLN